MYNFGVILLATGLFGFAFIIFVCRPLLIKDTKTAHTALSILLVLCLLLMATPIVLKYNDWLELNGDKLEEIYGEPEIVTGEYLEVVEDSQFSHNRTKYMLKGEPIKFVDKDKVIVVEDKERKGQYEVVSYTIKDSHSKKFYYENEFSETTIYK